MAFAFLFPASTNSSFHDGGLSADDPIRISAARRMPFRASSRINVAETAKAPLDMTAAVVEAAPHVNSEGLSALRIEQRAFSQ
jgi:hypothetical protein